MRVEREVRALALDRPVLAIGAFDGVHLGHRALLARMRRLAHDEGRPSAVVTFFPPGKVLFQGVPFLASEAEKLQLLGTYAPEAVAMIPFTRAYARTDPATFLGELASLHPSAIVVGEDFRFGRDRAGGLDDLQHVPERMEVFRLLLDGEEPIKSSRIRDLLAAGDMTEAERLLGAPYRAHGRVVAGDRRGREIGVPTANVAVPEGKAMPHGVFAVRVDTPQGRYDGMANVGPRPSFPEGAPSLEANLFDFAGDLYDQEVTVHFLARLRGQRRFGGVDDLTRQLALDREAAQAALAGRGDAGAGASGSPGADEAAEA